MTTTPTAAAKSKTPVNTPRKKKKQERQIVFLHIADANKFDVTKLQAAIAQTAPADRVMVLGDHGFTIWDQTRAADPKTGQAKDKYVWFMVGKSSSNDFGDLMKDGVLMNWSPPAGHNPIHLCHFVVFENKYIGFEVNGKSATATQIAYYLREKFPGAFSGKFATAISSDMAAELSAMKSINLFEFKVSKDRLSNLMAVNPGLGAVVRQALEMYGAGSIKIELRYDKDDDSKKFSDSIFGDLKKFIKNSANSKKALTNAKYRGYSEDGSELIELFKEKIGYTDTIKLDTKGNIISEEMYDAIVNRYESHKLQIRQSGFITGK